MRSVIIVFGIDYMFMFVVSLSQLNSSGLEYFELDMNMYEEKNIVAFRIEVKI